jgi:lipopolysaccharide transport system ATP-binding protein
MAKAITVEGLSKAYQLGDYGTGTISRDMERFIARVRGKEDPYLRIGETNDRTKKGESDIVWCLKDLNFDIEQGDAVGIIGRNGAGKSTLLKVLSRITSPTTGSIKIKGRIASLLEVGTGFHPELSGRENIYLNGAILGMRKSEIKRKLDEIIDFSGVERYIDTPVKRYSSGMYVRLAFAVAAHLESEILIVDEVLAVGDAEFQKKCLGKMGDISKGEGRTVLFVSHNMGSIMQLCEKSILLQHGELVVYDKVKSVIDKYLSSANKEDTFINNDKKNNFFREVFFGNNKSQAKSVFMFNEDITAFFKISIIKVIPSLTLSIVIKDQYDNPISASHYLIEGNLNDTIEVKAIIKASYIIPGEYKIAPLLHVPKQHGIEKIPFDINFSIEDSGGAHTAYRSDNLGSVVLPINWKNHDSQA